jgi:prepilin-type N-terminal cleavage/methylation domain-containing protein
MTVRGLRERPELRDDDGYSLIEMILTMLIFGVILVVLSSTMASSKKASDTTRLSNDLNSEARQALNRISRELRQARAIESVAAPNGATGLTFNVDFNGNGAIDNNAADPERLTYTWQNQNIYLSAADTSGTTVTQPILSGHVTAFSLQYFSSRYQYDCNGDGSTTWSEIDSGGGSCTTIPGNRNGALDTPELPYIDSVQLTLTALEGSHRQTYRTQIDLRNAR